MSPRPSLRQEGSSSSVRPLTDGTAPSSDTTRSPPKQQLAKWSVDPEAGPSRRRTGGGAAAGDDGDAPMGELTDESSDESDDDTDELDEGEGGDQDGDREMSGSVGGDQHDVSGKDLVYTLEVIQQPQRARACGFGDKDRRPLSPPPIIQLRIFDKLGHSIPPHAVDYHRFILMVDLWNSDQTQQRSIVMHPGARQDQYSLLTTHTGSRAPSSHSFEVPPPSFNRGPLRPGTAPGVSYGWGPGGGSGSSGGSGGSGGGGSGEWPAYGRHGQYYGSPTQTYPPPPPHGQHLSYGAPPTPVGGWPPGTGESSQRAASHSLSGTPSSVSRSVYAGGPPDDRYEEQRPSSSHSRHVSGGEHRPPSTVHDSRGWGHEAPPKFATAPDYDHPQSYAAGYRPATSASDGSWRKEPAYMARDGRPHTAGYGEWERMHAASARPWSSASDGDRRASHGPLFTHAPAASPHGSHPPLPMSNISPVATSSSLIPEYVDRVSSTSQYSRVLVGSMGAVCQRLKGLSGDPGLFFFAHDLGIRTEGTFSLRFTLVDISSLSVPGVTKDESAPILTRIFSKSFTVYSAKRFPGVLPTTDLTQCFADQSVRLPTRQKRTNGSGGSKRKK